MSVQSEVHMRKEAIFKLDNRGTSSYNISKILGGPRPRPSSKLADLRLLHEAEVISRSPLTAATDNLPATHVKRGEGKQAPQLQLKPSKVWEKEFLASLGLKTPDLVLKDLNIRKQAYLEPKVLRLSHDGAAVDYGDRVAYYPANNFLHRPTTHNPRAVEIRELVNTIGLRFNNVEVQGSEATRRMAASAVGLMNTANAQVTRMAGQANQYQGVVGYNHEDVNPSQSGAVKAVDAFANLATMANKWAGLNPIAQFKNITTPVAGTAPQLQPQSWEALRAPWSPTMKPPFHPSPFKPVA